MRWQYWILMQLYNYEHNCYIWSIRHNAGIILIFLQHNAVVSENCEKCIQILLELQLECSQCTTIKLYTLDSYPVHFGILEGLAWLPCKL